MSIGMLGLFAYFYPGIFSVLAQPLVLGVVVVVLVIGVAVFIYRRRRSSTTTEFEGWTSEEDPLSDEEIYELLEYKLFFDNIRIKDVAEQGVELASSAGDTDEAARIYKLEFDRRNIPERVGVLLDLGPSLKVNMNDLRASTRRIQNMKIIRSSKVTDFDERMRKARDQLARSSSQTIKITDYDEEGNPVKSREIPATARKLRTEEEVVEDEE